MLEVADTDFSGMKIVLDNPFSVRYHLIPLLSSLFQYFLQLPLNRGVLRSYWCEIWKPLYDEVLMQLIGNLRSEVQRLSTCCCCR
jgi:hypothetical protein